jgi:hypothetical protein
LKGCSCGDWRRIENADLVRLRALGWDWRNWVEQFTDGHYELNCVVTSSMPPWWFVISDWRELATLKEVSWSL